MQEEDAVDEYRPELDNPQAPRLLIVQVSGQELKIDYQGVTPLEAPTVLKLAAKMAERQVGVA